ncbi:hypothetical protein SO802_014926 [Lithocarpus litseifolius]|uniref:RNase H type-1 domain-containing protein n=1 Tax=Lithocarpus litseifolius TaxID=425828 RepID=A0AAW2CVJ7_9ROSI
MDNLTRRHIVDENMCPVCKTETEDPLHMVLGCPEVEQVSEDNRAELFICIARSLWQQRNTLRIGLLSPPLNLVGPQAASFCRTISMHKKISPQALLRLLLRTPGVIIRDRNGEVIAAMSECIPLPNSVLEFKAMACRRAVKFAYEVGIQEVIFEGDSLTVIQAINKGGASEAPYGNLIDY